MTLMDFLTGAQICDALALWKASETPAKAICEKVIAPNLEAINRKLGQKNDPMYLAYACEHVFNETRQREAAEGAAEYLKEEVARGGVAWKCQAGHLGLFRADSPAAKRMRAAGKGDQVYEMPKDDCPGCGEEN